MKQYRFFYHYFKQKHKMSVHFRGTCLIVDSIICERPCETKWRKRQPKLVMQGYASEVQLGHVLQKHIAHII